MRSDGASPSSQGQLVRESKTQQITVAGLGEAECCGCFQRGSTRRMPPDDGRDVVSLLRADKTFGRTESAVRFDADHKVFSTDMTRRSARERADGAGRADAVPELDAFAGRQVPLHDEILGDVPRSNHTR